MSRHKNIPNLEVRRKELMKPLRTPHPGPFTTIYLCPVVTCGQPLVRRNGAVVCSADPWHFKEEVRRNGREKVV